MPPSHGARAVAAVPESSSGHGLGGVCETTPRRPWAGAEVSRALYPSRGDRQSPPAGTRGRAGDVSLDRLCPRDATGR
jgi:hypothetical protein